MQVVNDVDIDHEPKKITTKSRHQRTPNRCKATKNCEVCSHGQVVLLMGWVDEAHVDAERHEKRMKGSAG